MEYKYIDRAKCMCGYIWTTLGRNIEDPDSDSVICACGDLEFIEGVLSDASLDIVEADFKQAVADELSVDVNELTLIQQ